MRTTLLLTLILSVGRVRAIRGLVQLHSPGGTLDRSLGSLFVLAAVHFLLKSFAAVWFGSGASAALYLSSRYAMISQTVTGVILIAIGLVLLMTVLQTVIAFNRAEARTDVLTGLPNRRALYEEFERHRTAADGSPLALAILDLDRFKVINDQLGHDAGDRVLRAFAASLGAQKPPGAFAARIGGEEFVVLLPQDLRDALISTEMLRSSASGLKSVGFSITASAGLTRVLPGEDLADAIRRADRGLYRAKVAGRDRTSVEDPDQPQDWLTVRTSEGRGNV